MLNPLRVIKKIIYQEQTLTHALGRFKGVRCAYSLYIKLRQSLVLSRKNEQKKPTIFEDIPIELTIKNLENLSVYCGIKLSQNFINSIKNFAEITEFTREDGLENFCYKDVKNGYLPDGRPVPQAIATKPLECDAIRQIINDPLIKKVVSKYLKYEPNNAVVFLRWSFVLELPDEMRIQLHQTVNYHYDIWGLNSVFVNFYLSNTDINSGAHVMIKSSHNKKSLRMLFDSVSQTEEFLLNYYGQENKLVIEGEEGYGFFQDPYCYHKALAPVSRERLMLQIRYS